MCYSGPFSRLTHAMLALAGREGIDSSNSSCVSVPFSCRRCRDEDTMFAFASNMARRYWAWSLGCHFCARGALLDHRTASVSLRTHDKWSRFGPCPSPSYPPRALCTSDDLLSITKHPRSRNTLPRRCAGSVPNRPSSHLPILFADQLDLDIWPDEGVDIPQYRPIGELSRDAGPAACLEWAACLAGLVLRGDAFATSSTMFKSFRAVDHVEGDFGNDPEPDEPRSKPSCLVPSVCISCK